MEARIREFDMQITDPVEYRDDEKCTSKKEERKDLSILNANKALGSWFVFLGFGGFFLILHYCRIGYFPELEWEKSLTFLAAISLLGGGISVIYGLALVIPGILWSEFLIFDQLLRQKLCYLGPDGREPCFQNLLKKLVLPFAVFVTSIHIVTLLQSTWILIITSVVGLASLCAHSHKKFKKALEEIKQSSTNEYREKYIVGNESTCLYKYTAVAGMAAFASLISFLVVVAIASPSRESAGLLVACTLAVIVSNLFVAAQFHRKPVHAILTGVIATLILLISGEILAAPQEALSTRVLNQFGIGELQVKENLVTIVTSKAGGQILKANHIRGVEFFDQNASIQNARILSRIGDEYFIQVENRRIAIPKKEVLSWSKIRP